MKLLLDIDGTLIKLQSGTGFGPFKKAMKACFGIDLSIPANARPETDFSFVREMVGESEFCRMEDSLGEFYHVYAEMLRSSLTAHPPQQTPNAREFLLSAREMNVACIPFTGNAKEPALAKLQASNLLDLLEVDKGAYGDTLLTKKDVLKQFMSDCEKCVVLGDSIADIIAARSCDVPVVTLATGWTAIDVLKRSSPDLAIDRIPSHCKSLINFCCLVSDENGTSCQTSFMESAEPEEMRAYFDARADVYDDMHMKDDISWGRGIRDIVAKFVPNSARTILDIGAGTGIEIEGILRRNHSAKILCVDLSPCMLSRLKAKFSENNVIARECDFREMDIPEKHFDAVVSVMALHHLTYKEKTRLYRSVLMSLRPNGVFINSDYILDEKVEQCVMDGIAEYKQNATDAEGYYHIDRPLCEENERRLLETAGFRSIDKPYENKKAKVLIART